jgi:nucleoside-diphosphate-sugar epimerase
VTRWVVLGAGYTGSRIVAAVIARGEAVIATRRSEGDRRVDLRSPDTLIGLFAAGDVVVMTAPPIDDVGTGERAIAETAAAAGVARIVYLSTTGVYAPAAGAWVDEDFAIAPITRTGRARVAAEAMIATTTVPIVALRVAGIYGPGRGVVARLRAGSYRIVGDGRTFVSRIHVDDLVSAIVAAGSAPVVAAVYNVADDDPTPSLELATAAALALGVPPPACVGIDGIDPDVVGMLTADRRIDNARLKRELGWTLRYPSWRVGLAEEIR